MRRQLKPQWALIPLAGLVMSACTASCGPKPGRGPDDTTGPEPFSWRINPAVAPAVPALPAMAGAAERPVAAYVDSKGVQTDFVANEVLITPASKEELDAFLQRYQGVIVDDDRVPQPPASTNLVLPDAQLQPTSYTVLIQQFPQLDSLPAEAEARGMSGEYQFSSDAAGRLLALTAKESNAGLDVIPNFVMTPSGMLHATEEMPVPDGYVNAFGWDVFKGKMTGDGNRSTVYAAWQYLEAKGYAPGSVLVAIIDGGFWLDEAGVPYTSSSGIGSDLPLNIQQYDFFEKDYFAGGASPTKCSGGSACPWHGNDSASVATGLVNNRAAAAGTGGQVAAPMLFRIQVTMSQVRNAVLTATQWGAKVINMSFGGSCNDDCIAYQSKSKYFKVFEMARSVGVVLIAAAGNSSVDSAANNVMPCTIEGVICVGALKDGLNSRIEYSNFGPAIDIWAPTNIPSMPNGASPDQLANAGGTSAAAPFVAGVAAMLKAVQPALSSDGVEQIFKATAWNTFPYASEDPAVKPVGYLNALEALRMAAGPLPDDALEPNNSAQKATIPTAPATYEKLTLKKGDLDYFKFTFTEYNLVAVELYYMAGLGEISVSVKPEAGAPKPASVKIQKNDQKYSYMGTFAPGSYTLLLSAGASTTYSLSYGTGSAPLNPDQFEPNPNEASPALPNDGFFELNLHENSDVDVFSFTIPQNQLLVKGLRYYAFAIDSDLPVTTQLLDANKVVLSTSTDTSKEFAFEEDDAGKDFYVRVQSTGPVTKYTLGKGIRLVKTPFGPWLTQDAYLWSTPLGPDAWMGVMSGPEEWLSLQGSASLGNINLVGVGLSLELLDSAGQMLGVGENVVRSHPTLGEEWVGRKLNAKGLTQPGQSYFLKIGRTEGAQSPADGSATVLPKVDYSLTAESAN